MRDTANGTPLYSNGFGSIYDEWVTTDEASKVTRTFHESVRFPMPAAPVTVTIRKRGAANQWTDAWTTTVDPKSLNTAKPSPSPGDVIGFQVNGDSSAKVDLLLLGDGYTAAERPKFEADARRLLDAFRRRRSRTAQRFQRAGWRPRPIRHLAARLPASSRLADWRP